MRFLALNQEQLSRLSHHRIWGLRVDAGGGDTLDKAVTGLEADDSLRQRREKEVAKISQRIWIIQAIGRRKKSVAFIKGI